MVPGVCLLSPAPMTPSPHRLPVISTGVEKSHSSMVQAALGREISRLRVSIEPKHICPPPARSPARDDKCDGPLSVTGEGWVTPHCHFDRSGEIPLPYAANRLASPAFLPTSIYYHRRHQLHAPRFFTSFRMTIPAGRLHGAWRLPSFPTPMTPSPHRLPVISTGVEESPSPMLPAGFASPAFLLACIYHHCRHQLHAPRFFTSFRMTAPAGRLHGAWRLPSFPAPMTPSPHCLPVISTGVEKSHSSMVQAALGWEISRLRVSIESKHICPPPARSPARDDRCGGLLSVTGEGGKRCHASLSFRPKWRNLTPPWYKPHWGGKSLDSEFQ